MAHALNNASHTSACAELGISVGNDRNQTTLTRHATMNKWSFYRVGLIAPNATTKLIELTAPSNNDKLGDFRGYNHGASVPTTPVDFDRNWGPGGTTISITFSTYVNEWNLRESTSGSVPYISVRYYLTSTARNSKSGSVRTYTVLATETANTPPTGHTNNQTARPAAAQQLITDASFPTSLITKPDDVLYVDIYISNSSGTEVARFGAAQSDGHVDVDTHEYSNPFIDGCGPNVSGAPSSPAFIVVTNSSSGKDGVDISRSNGDTTTGLFYWYVVMLISGTWYRIGSVAATANLVTKNPEGGTTQNTTAIFSGTLNTAGLSSNQQRLSMTLSSGYSFAWDDVADVEVTIPSWTGYSSYSLGSTAPTCT